MQAVIYDGTFSGWLSCVFDVYEHGFTDVAISKKERFQANIFGTAHHVVSSEANAKRVWKGLQKKLSSASVHQLYQCWLSELPDIDDTLLSYARYAFASPVCIGKDYSHPAVLAVTQVARKVFRETHRMEAFIRFQLTKDGLYYAIAEPDYNVLPLLVKHFKNRYADQRWMIYDGRRHFGIYYDLQTVEQVEVNFEPGTSGGKSVTALYNEDELLYQQLWQKYFNSVNIAARKNMKLHIQHMPRRYWKYLTEKAE